MYKKSLLNEATAHKRAFIRAEMAEVQKQYAEEVADAAIEANKLMQSNRCGAIVGKECNLDKMTEELDIARQQNENLIKAIKSLIPNTVINLIRPACMICDLHDTEKCDCANDDFISWQLAKRFKEDENNE